jgi:hypothetical protein
MDFYGFADQTLIEISKVSPLTWFRICELVPFIGEWTPCPSTQRLVKKPFIHAVKDQHKNIRHYLNAAVHRDGDFPSVEWANGDKAWYVFGQRHRDNDLPAIEYAEGTKIWYVSGQMHRDNDLPAYEGANGTKIWYVSGQRHRDNDLPAIVYVYGFKAWYKKGKHYQPKF